MLKARWGEMRRGWEESGVGEKEEGERVVETEESTRIHQISYEINYLLILESVSQHVHHQLACHIWFTRKTLPLLSGVAPSW